VHFRPDAHFAVGVQATLLVTQVPEVASGQSASTAHAAFTQLALLLSQVNCVHLPLWGAQSALVMQVEPSTLQVALRQSRSDEQNLPLMAQVPEASPPRQLLPSSQSTPASVGAVVTPVLRL
jgi:hypothetical protein